MDWIVAQKLALSIGLGLLVGLQREWTAPRVAGIRTFTLITMFGTMVGLLTDPFGYWLVVAGLVAIGAMAAVASHAKAMRAGARAGSRAGLTTQVCMLIMYIVGVALSVDQTILAIIVTGVVAVLLQWKGMLHGFVDRIGEKDIRAIFQLVLIGLVILPLVPNEGYGPYKVINPFEIWLMVVLICGISVGSYLASKYLGTRAGTVLSSVLGGLISSTATTVSYSRRSKKVPSAAGLASIVIMIASTIVFARVIIEVAVVGPSILPKLVAPLAVMMGWMTIICVILYVCTRKEEQQVLLDEDPSDLKAAIIFGILYGVVLFAVAAVRENLSDEWLYLVAAISGLTDMDAITLSTVQLIKAEGLSIDTGWRMILIGAMSNLIFKAGAVAVLGNGRLLGRIALVFGLSLAGGVVILMYWP